MDQENKESSRKRNVFIRNWKVLIFLLIVGLVIWRLRVMSQPKYEVETERITRESLVETVSASGEVSADKFAKLTFLASENIEEILVGDGEFVDEGDIIARLNSSSLYQSYLIAEADLRDKKATLDRVYDDLKDKDDSETYDEKETRTTAEVAKDKAYRNFVIAQKNLSNATLRAPFKGIVSFNQGTSIGKLSLTSTPTFTIVDPETVYFLAEVNELDVGKIKVGMKAEINLDAFPDETFEENVKSVSYVSTTTSTGGTAYLVKITLPQLEENKIKIGMNGDVDFIIEEVENTLTIPQSALVEDENTFVWVVENGVARKKDVETGISSIDEVEISKGLSESESIIVNPPIELKEGDRVKVL